MNRLHTQVKAAKEATTDNGDKVRHRRPAECRQVNAVQCADRGGDRRRRTIRSAPSSRTSASCRCPIRGSARLRGIVKPQKIDSDDHGIRGHRRPGRRRFEGRGARQPVSRQHPRDERDRARRALFRERRRHPRRRPHRPGRRHRDRSTPNLRWRISSRSKSNSRKRERNAKTDKKARCSSRDTLAKVKAHLDEGGPVRSLGLSEDEAAL